MNLSLHTNLTQNNDFNKLLTVGNKGATYGLISNAVCEIPGKLNAKRTTLCHPIFRILPESKTNSNSLSLQHIL